MRARFHLGRLLFCAASLIFTPQGASAQGGPPLLTDDPGTPGNRHWEINAAFNIEKRSTRRLFETPRIDINYGLGEHIQLKLEVPWLVLQGTGQPRKTGLGNSLVGVKWRFVDAEKHGFAMSIYPQLEFNNPTASVRRGLVERGAQLLLPLEVTRKVGPLDINGEVGYRVVEQQANELLYGLAFGSQVTKRLELLGEIHGTPKQNLSENELLFNLGLRYKLSNHYTLLFSSGRSFYHAASGQPTFIAYTGMQFNF